MPLHSPEKYGALEGCRWVLHPAAGAPADSVPVPACSAGVDNCWPHRWCSLAPWPGRGCPLARWSLGPWLGLAVHPWLLARVQLGPLVPHPCPVRRPLAPRPWMLAWAPACCKWGVSVALPRQWRSLARRSLGSGGVAACPGCSLASWLGASGLAPCRVSAPPGAVGAAGCVPGCSVRGVPVGGAKSLAAGSLGTMGRACPSLPGGGGSTPRPPPNRSQISL